MANKHRYTSRAGWYWIEYPDDWVVEEIDDLVTLYRPEGGVGALQISAFQTPGPQDCRDVLLEYLADQNVSIDGETVIVQQQGKKSISTYSYEEGDWYRKVWIVSQDEYVLFTTYNCRAAFRDYETTDADAMVLSIQIIAD